MQSRRPIAARDWSPTEWCNSDPWFVVVSVTNETRCTQRDGTRTTVVSTNSGDLSLKIAKTCTGSFFLALLHPRRRIDVALHTVVMRPTCTGRPPARSTTWPPRWGISTSEVSRICSGLDTDLAAFNGRDLAGQAFPYVFHGWPPGLSWQARAPSRRGIWSDSMNDGRAKRQPASHSAKMRARQTVARPVSVGIPEKDKRRDGQVPWGGVRRLRDSSSG